MSSTYINIPNPNNSSTVITSDSPNIIVNMSGDAYSIGFDPMGIIANQAAAVVTDFTAGEMISALTVVYYDEATGTIFKADSDTLIKASALGITMTAGMAGSTIKVIQYGLLTDSSFSLDPADLIFLGHNGLITTTAVSEGYLTRLGRAIDSTTILVLIESPVTL